MDEDFRNNLSFINNMICYIKVGSTKPYIILICLSCLTDPEDHAFWKRRNEAPLHKDWCFSLSKFWSYLQFGHVAQPQPQNVLLVLERWLRLLIFLCLKKFSVLECSAWNGWFSDKLVNSTNLINSRYGFFQFTLTFYTSRLGAVYLTWV